MIQQENKSLDIASTHVYRLTGKGTSVFTRRSELALQVSSCLDPGITRRHRPNEDTLLVMQGAMHSASPFIQPKPFVLLLVADGMGGQGHGQEASSLAARCLREYVESSLCYEERTPKALLSLLLAGVQRANTAVYKRNQQQGTNMGTTITTALVYETTAYVAHVGDSRLYLYREPAGLMQITHDHSLVAMLVETKIIASDDIYTHPARNQIYRSLGTNATVDVDTFSVPLSVEDNLLLCSDGLWEMVHNQPITAILRTLKSKPEQASSALLQAALAAGGQDNISAIVARVISKHA